MLYFVQLMGPDFAGSFLHSDVGSLFYLILCFVVLFSFSAEEEESTSGDHSSVATEKVVVPWKLEDKDNSSRYSVSIPVKLRK